MDTYYNPIPHFGYDLALSHSPQVRWARHLPRYTPEHEFVSNKP